MAESRDRGGDGNPVPESEPEVSVGRRCLVGATMGLFGVGYAGAIGYPMYRYLHAPVERAALAAQVTEVSPQGAQDIPPGQAMGFMFGSRPAVLIHHADGQWSAFDAVCTQLSCTVKYEPENDRIFCACHLGTYDPRSGEPTSGPPPRALTKFVVKEKDGAIVVSRN